MCRCRHTWIDLSYCYCSTSLKSHVRASIRVVCAHALWYAQTSWGSNAASIRLHNNFHYHYNTLLNWPEKEHYSVYWVSLSALIGLSYNSMLNNFVKNKIHQERQPTYIKVNTYNIYINQTYHFNTKQQPCKTCVCYWCEPPTNTQQLKPMWYWMIKHQPGELAA